jgi:hypothetical protein
MVLKALQMEDNQDFIQLEEVFQKFRSIQIEIASESALEQKQLAKKQLSDLFAEIFKKISDYFSALGIDGSKFSYPVIKDEPTIDEFDGYSVDESNVGDLGKYIARMIGYEASKIRDNGGLKSKSSWSWRRCWETNNGKIH